MPFATKEGRNRWQREYTKKPHVKAARKKHRQGDKFRAWYSRYVKTPVGLALVKRRNLKKHQIYEEIIRESKKEPCIDCGGRFPSWCMDFHHARGVKKFQIGRGWAKSKGVLEEELAKCDLLCANCHRIRHVNGNGQVISMLTVMRESEILSLIREK